MTEPSRERRRIASERATARAMIGVGIAMTAVGILAFVTGRYIVAWQTLFGLTLVAAGCLLVRRVGRKLTAFDSKCADRQARDR